MQSEQLTVPFDRLIRDDAANVRKKYSADAIEEMKASILAHGVVQSIAARPPVAGDADLGGQLYRIFAGGRRWVAIGELVKEGKLTPDFPVPIILRETDDATAVELSLAENLIREQMTPADEFRAFLQLVESGKSIEDIALHFGVSERYVKGRLALARLHPEILAAFEEGKLSFGAACAYTTNPDQKVQAEFFNSGHWNVRESYAIKHAMARTAVASDSGLAKFIGADAYKAAGGVVHEDLFGEDSLWTSIELMPDLKAQAVERVRAEALADGWSFFATTEELGIDRIYDLRRLHPDGCNLTDEEQNRMDEISELLEGAMEDDPENEKLEAEYASLDAKANAFSSEQKAKSGVVLDMEFMEIRYGCLKPGQKVNADGDVQDDDGPLAKAAKPAKDPLALTQPLKDKIGETATAALGVAVAADPHKALALVAAMLDQANNRTMGIGRPSRIQVERYEYVVSSGDEKKQRGIWKAFDAYVKLTDDELTVAVARLAATTADLSEKWFQKDYTSDDIRAKTRADFLNAFDANPLEQFDPEDWFSACTKPMIDAAMKEMTGFSATKPKKADMAREAVEKARETGWLPAELRLKGFALKGGAPKPKPKSKKKAA